MEAKRNLRKPIIFGYCKEVLQTVIMIYFAANLVFGEEESEFCKRGWSEFVKARKQYERECLNEDDIKISSCCNESFTTLKTHMETTQSCVPLWVSFVLIIVENWYLPLRKFCCSLMSGIQKNIIN